MAGGVGFRVVTLLGPEALETAWINKDKALSSTRGWQPVIGPFFHRGIMLLDFEEHRDHRRIMQQAFARSALHGYLDLTSYRVVQALSDWEPADRFPIYPSIKHLLLQQATEVFIGTELGPEASQLAHDFHDIVRGGQAVDVPGGTWVRGLRPRERLETYFHRQIPSRRRGDGAERFSNQDVVNHMIFLMMAAHDTTAIALSMLVYELGRNQHWQSLLRGEAERSPVD